jgi:hypothetical protein
MISHDKMSIHVVVRRVTKDKERLIRLLRMTESDRDAEVLVAIRKSNELLRAHDKTWSDVIDLPPPPKPQPYRESSTDRPYADRMGFQRSDAIRGAIRREFPITLAFFPLWIAAELMAIFFPNTYWNRNGRSVVATFWSLCGLGLLSWLGAGAWLLTTVGP